MNEQSAFIIKEESHEKIVKENEEEKRKELKRIKTNARQRAYYQRQKNLKKNAEKIKKVPKSNAERQRQFRQRNAEKSYMDIRREWLQQINRKDLTNKSNFGAYRVCENHFTIKDIWQAKNRKLLKKNTVPSLLLPSNTPNRFQYNDKETQTFHPIRQDQCTQTDNVTNKNNAEITSLFHTNPTKRKLKAELLQCRKEMKLLATQHKQMEKVLSMFLAKNC